MRQAIRFGIFAGALAVLAGCEVLPMVGTQLSLESDFQACDRQAQLCRSSYGGGVQTYGVNGCDVQADRCFSRAYAYARSAYGANVLSSSYVFYGRVGNWSPRYGYRSTYGRGYSGYGSAYDDPYDCYGVRRASYCYGYSGRDRRYDRDRDRDRRDDDRKGGNNGKGDRPAPPKPPSGKPVTPPKAPSRRPDKTPTIPAKRPPDTPLQRNQDPKNTDPR